MSIVTTCAEVIEGFVVCGETDDSLEGLTNGCERTPRRVQGHAMHQDIEGILGHVGKDIEEGLAIANVVREQRVGLSGCSEGVAAEQDVEKTDTDCPDVRSGRGVSVAGAGLELFRSHISVTADAILGAPVFEGRETEVAKLHRAILRKKDVLWLDISVIDAFAMHVFYSTDQLKHEIADMLGLERSLPGSDGFVEITIWAVLESEIGVTRGLERADEVDDVGMEANARVHSQLL